MYWITFTDKNSDDWYRKTDDLQLTKRVIENSGWKILSIDIL